MSTEIPTNIRTPRSIPFEIIELEKAEFFPDDKLDIEAKDGSFELHSSKGWMFFIKAKDLYRNHEYDKMLKEGKIKYLCFHGASGQGILKIDAWVIDDWECIWRANNNFRSYKQSKKDEDGYAAFIESEAKNISQMIDKGYNLKYINEHLSDGHTGNTFGCAMGLGISLAKDKHYSKKVRDAHNKEYGVAEGAKGVVNPAILTINVDAKKKVKLKDFNNENRGGN